MVRAHPRRQRRVVGDGVEQGHALGHEAGRFPRRRRRPVIGVEQLSQRRRRIGLQRQVRVRRLEAHDIEVAQPRPFRDGRHGCRGRSLGPARLERHRQTRNGAKHVRPQQGAMPGDRRAPVVADDDAGRLAQGPDQIDHIPDQVQDRIGRRAFGLVGSAIAPHVGRDDMIACCAQRLDLRPPADRQFRKAVDQQDQRRVVLLEPAFQHLLDKPVGLDKPRSHSNPSGGVLTTLRSGRT